ncbi:zinc transporter ZupT [Candidatus Woesearchaeota archaeon]|nr:zinc transporter ZupT [Candidatus Woesearchaeota archaeon]
MTPTTDFNQIAVPLLLTFIAGISTGFGSIISLFIKKLRHSYLSFMMGFSAGVLIYVSFVELLGSAINDVGFVFANLSFFLGILFILTIDFFIPHEYIEERVNLPRPKRKLLIVGIFIAVGIAIHNFPEGIAVFFTSLKDINMGIPLAFAIAIHNIPEGLMISMPIYYATKSKAKAFWISLFSGFVEPIGAIIGFFILFSFLNEVILILILAFAGGIMVFISFDELIPITFKKGTSHLALIGIILGMLVMAGSLQLFP